MGLAVVISCVFGGSYLFVTRLWADLIEGRLVLVVMFLTFSVLFLIWSREKGSVQGLVYVFGYGVGAI